MVWASGAALSEVESALLSSSEEDPEEHDPIANTMAMIVIDAQMIQTIARAFLLAKTLRPRVGCAGRTVRLVGFLGC